MKSEDSFRHQLMFDSYPFWDSMLSQSRSLLLLGLKRMQEKDEKDSSPRVMMAFSREAGRKKLLDFKGDVINIFLSFKTWHSSSWGMNIMFLTCFTGHQFPFQSYSLQLSFLQLVLKQNKKNPPQLRRGWTPLPLQQGCASVEIDVEVLRFIYAFVSHTYSEWV